MKTGLSSSEERFAKIFRSNPTPMSITSLDGRHLDVNESWLRAFEYTRDQIIGRTVDELGLLLSHSEDTAAVMRGLLEHGSHYDVEMKVRTRSGGERIGLVAIELVELDGEPRALSTFVDITERRRAEEALRETTGRYGRLVNSIDGIVWEADGKTFRFNFVSQRAETLLGYPIARWLDQEHFWRDHIHPDDRSRTVAFCVAATEQRRDHEFDYRMVAADGRTVWLHDLVKVVSEEGGALKLRGVMVDITARKQAEAEREQLLIREQEARREAEVARNRLAVLVRATGLLASSLEYRATLSNVVRMAIPDLADGAALYLFGEDGEIDLVEVTMSDPALDEEAHTWGGRHVVDLDSSHPAARIFRTGEPFLIGELSEPELEWANDDPMLLEFLRRVDVRSSIAAPMRARGRVIGALMWMYRSASGRRYELEDLAIAVDVAQRAALAVDNARLYAAAHEANRLKDEFLATLSHELRTPLNAILGWVQLLREKAIDEGDEATALESIERNAELQTQLVSELLDVSRIITGKLSLGIRPIDLRRVVHAALETVKPAADAKGITLETAFDDAVGPVDGDSARLQQVVWNLLSNAIKFTPREGRVRVSLTQSGGSVELRVHDTGEGISSDFAPHLFEHFRQADSSTTRPQGGLGLGLALVRHLVELHGGMALASSEGPGRGSTFIVKLPISGKRTTRSAP